MTTPTIASPIAANGSAEASAPASPSSTNKRKAETGSSSETEDELVLPTSPRKSLAKDGSAADEANKKPKLASIFTLGKTRSATSSSRAELGADQGSDAASSSTSASKALVWHDSLGQDRSCLHATFLAPRPSARIALFDLDGTLVRPKGNKQFPSAKDEYDYKFCFPGVIAAVQKAYHDGYAIVIVSNQKQTPYSGKLRLETWKKKVAHIARALQVPLRIFAALATDAYRKPCLGIWDDFRARFNGGLVPDLTTSYYVGDAAGRKGISVRDHSDTDYKWALNAGLRFYTPEQFFQAAKEELKLPLRPWEARTDSLDRLPIFGGPDAPAKTERDEALFWPSDTPLIPTDRRTEVVLFVGSPASGKTAFYKRHLQKEGYEWVNQDTLRTRDKCVATVARCIEEGKSCVVDNTNRDKATRQHYIQLAKETSTPIRCFIFDVAKHLCHHNNHFRGSRAGPSNEARRDVMPPSVIEAFFKDVQTPKIEEGFSEEPKRIRWRFEGDEALRKRYEMYYH